MQTLSLLPVCADLYEAYVLWSFYMCMVESFGSQEKLLEKLEERGTAVMLAPFCCVRQSLTFQWLQRMTLGVAQYVFVRVTLSILIFVLLLTGELDGAALHGSVGLAPLALCNQPRTRTPMNTLRMPEESILILSPSLVFLN